MKQFEFAFTLGEDLTEPKAKTAAGEIKDLIAKHGGKINHHVYWGKKKLTYQIQKNTYGYFFITIFEIDGPAIEALTKDINMDDRILRYLITDFYKDTELPVERGLERDSEGKKEDKTEEKPKEVKEKKSPKKEVKEETPATEEVTAEKEEAATTDATETQEDKMKKITDEQDRKKMMDDQTRKAELEKRIAEM